MFLVLVLLVFLVKPTKPARTTIARGFPGPDAVTSDQKSIKFGDFEVQLLDDDKIMVYLDDLIFVDGMLVTGLPGPPDYNNNNHNISDEPVPKTAILGRQLEDQELYTEDSDDSKGAAAVKDLCDTVALCNQTIADLVDKRLLKFTKSQRGVFKKHSVSHHRERDDVVSVLNRLNNQSRQVVKIHDEMADQLKVKRRNQQVLEQVVVTFGNEIRVGSSQRVALEKNIGSLATKCRELKNHLREATLRWKDSITVKEQECEGYKDEIAQILRQMEDKDQAFDGVSADLKTAKSVIKELQCMDSQRQNCLEELCLSLKGAEISRDALIEEKATLESKIGCLEDELVDQIQRSVKQMDTLHSQYEADKTHAEKVARSKLAAKDVAIEGYLSELKILETKVSEQEEQVMALEEKHQIDVISLTDSFEAQLSDQKALSQDLQLEVQSVQTTLDNEKQLHADTVSVIKTGHEMEVEKMNKSMEDILFYKDVMIENLETNMENLKKQITEQKETVSQKDKVIQFMQAEIEDLKRKLDEKERYSFPMDAAINGSQSAIRDLKDQLEEQKEFILHKSTVIQNLEGELGRLDEQMKEQKELILHKNVLIQALQDEAEDLGQQLRDQHDFLIDHVKSLDSRNQNEKNDSLNELEQMKQHKFGMLKANELLHVKIFVQNCMMNAVANELKRRIDGEQVYFKEQLRQAQIDNVKLVIANEELRAQNEETQRMESNLPKYEELYNFPGINMEETNITGDGQRLILLQKDDTLVQRHGPILNVGLFPDSANEMGVIQEKKEDQEGDEPEGTRNIQMLKCNCSDNDQVVKAETFAVRVEHLDSVTQRGSRGMGEMGDVVTRNELTLVQEDVEMGDKHGDLAQTEQKPTEQGEMEDLIRDLKTDLCDAQYEVHQLNADKQKMVLRMRMEQERNSEEMVRMRALVNNLKKDGFTYQSAQRTWFEERERLENITAGLMKDIGDAQEELNRLQSEKTELIDKLEKERKDNLQMSFDLKNWRRIDEAVRVEAQRLRDAGSSKRLRKMSALNTRMKTSYRQLQETNAELEDERWRLKERGYELEDELAQLDRDLEDCGREIDGLTADLDKAEKMSTKKTNRINQMERQIKNLKRERDGLRDSSRGCKNNKK